MVYAIEVVCRIHPDAEKSVNIDIVNCIVNFSMYLADIVGPIIGGFIASKVNFETTALTFSGINIFLGIVIILFFRLSICDEIVKVICCRFKKGDKTKVESLLNETVDNIKNDLDQENIKKFG